MRLSEAVRVVAIFEAAKGALILLAGFGLLSLVHRDVHELATQLITHAHLNPASRYPHIFIDAANHVTDSRLMLYAVGAAVYACVRLVEAWGLWFERIWAEWLAAVSGGLYVPVELVKLYEHASWLGLGVLLVNLAVVALMVRTVSLRRAPSGDKPRTP
jgi:uncharacterized membrane protein (DUF2068 family)